MGKKKDSAQDLKKKTEYIEARLAYEEAKRKLDKLRTKRGPSGRKVRAKGSRRPRALSPPDDTLRLDLQPVEYL